MKQLTILTFLAGLLLVIVADLSAEAQSRYQVPMAPVKLTCADDGSSTSTITGRGWHRLAVANEETCICFGSATCAEADAACYGPGTVLDLKLDDASTTVSCVSTAGTGKVEFIRLNP